MNSGLSRTVWQGGPARSSPPSRRLGFLFPRSSQCQITILPQIFRRYRHWIQFSNTAHTPTNTRNTAPISRSTCKAPTLQIPWVHLTLQLFRYYLSPFKSAFPLIWSFPSFKANTKRRLIELKENVIATAKYYLLLAILQNPTLLCYSLTFWLPLCNDSWQVTVLCDPVTWATDKLIVKYRCHQKYLGALNAYCTFHPWGIEDMNRIQKSKCVLSIFHVLGYENGKISGPPGIPLR